MSFHPSPSIDCHTTPMEVQLPFIQEIMDKPDYRNNNGNKPDEDDVPRSHSSSTVGKTCCDYHTKSGQYIFRCPPTRFGKSLFSDDLLCISQIGTVAFYQALLSEFIGTMLLTLICTSTGLPITNKPVPDLHGALAIGFVIATIVVGFGHISGAHINPAVTISFLVACEIDIFRALCYIGIQLLGAISGSCLLKFLAPSHAQGNLGLNTITEGVTISQAIVVEFIITFILCFTVHAICDKKREDIGGSKALAVGLAIIVGCLFGGPYTGASMNPARSFGPATVMNSWENHWVYWFGPLTGSVVAAIMYTYIFELRPPIVVRTDSTRPRTRSFIGKPMNT
jgi:MIP family channel proteins